MTHICVSKLTIIGSDNGLSPGQHQAIIWTNAGILLIGPLGTNFNENFNHNSYIFILENPFETFVWKMAAISSRPQCVKWCSHQSQESSEWLQIETLVVLCNEYYISSELWDTTVLHKALAINSTYYQNHSVQPGAYFTKDFSHHNSNSMEISLCSFPNYCYGITEILHMP